MSPPSGAHESERFPPRRALALLTLALAIVVVVGAWAFRGTSAIASTSLPVWLVALAFSASELFVVDIPSRRERDTTSLSELPLVLSLFFLSPVATMAAQVVGTAAALVGPMRQRGLKLCFNLTQVAIQSLVAIVVFRLLLGGAHASDPRAWIVAMVATLTADALSGILVTFAMWLHSGSFQRELTSWALVAGAIAGVAKTAVALIAVVSITNHVANVIALVLIVMVVMYLAFRGYAGLYLRHVRVEKLYQFTRALTSSTDPADLAERAMREARELLRGNGAELVLTGALPLVVFVHDEEVVPPRFGGVDAPVGELFGAECVVAHLGVDAPDTLQSWLDRRHWAEALRRAGWQQHGRRLARGRTRC